MRDETPPWAETVDDATPSSVDPRVLGGMTLWLVAFGWYAILQATPRGGLTMTGAALLYGAVTFMAGLGFGNGEDQVATRLRAVFDRTGLVLGGVAIGSAGLTWVVATSPKNPYTAGLWLGVVLLSAGIAIGAAAR